MRSAFLQVFWEWVKEASRRFHFVISPGSNMLSWWSSCPISPPVSPCSVCPMALASAVSVAGGKELVVVGDKFRRRGRWRGRAQGGDYQCGVGLAKRGDEKTPPSGHE